MIDNASKHFETGHIQLLFCTYGVNKGQPIVKSMLRMLGDTRLDFP